MKTKQPLSKSDKALEAIIGLKPVPLSKHRVDLYKKATEAAYKNILANHAIYHASMANAHHYFYDK